MKNLMQETGEAFKKVWAIKIWRVILALVLVAGLASVAYLPGRQVLADSRGDGKSADVIFTKWVTTAGPGISAFPPGNDSDVIFNMAGVDSGDTGPGEFTGEVLLYNDPTGHTSTIHAHYHINGLKHSFIADVHVTQDNGKGTAVIRGKVTDGWMKGAEVSGNYQVINPSGIINAQNGVGGDICYQGTLHIERR